jgi:hypothetical protein
MRSARASISKASDHIQLLGNFASMASPEPGGAGFDPGLPVLNSAILARVHPTPALVVLIEDGFPREGRASCAIYRCSGAVDARGPQREEEGHVARVD